MIIVDSSVWIDFYNGRATEQTLRLQSLFGKASPAIGDVILLEVLRGFRTDTDYRKAKNDLLSLMVFEMLGIENAIRSAAHYRALRKRGITIRKPNDVIIASFCISEGHTLLHSDRDFHLFASEFGLREVIPFQPSR